MSGGLKIRVTMTGAEDLARALKGVGDEVAQRNILLDACRKAAQPIAETARRLAPRSNDGKGKALADSIVVTSTLSRNQRYKRGGRRAQAEVFVGPKAPHGHLVEFGHALVKVRRSRTEFKKLRSGRVVGVVLDRRVIGRVAPRPFMRPAIDSTRQLALTTLQRELFAAVQRAVVRWGNQARAGRLSKSGHRAIVNLARQPL